MKNPKQVKEEITNEEYIKSWFSYINGLERLAWNLPSNEERDKLQVAINTIKGLVQIATKNF